MGARTVGKLSHLRPELRKDNLCAGLHTFYFTLNFEWEDSEIILKKLQKKMHDLWQIVLQNGMKNP